MNKSISKLIAASIVMLFAWTATTFSAVVPDKAGMTIKGMVHSNGTGIPDVVVSDGNLITTTDQNGYYWLPSDKKNGFVFISIPGNYEVAKTGSAPQFFHRVSGSAVEQKDFALTPVNNEKHVVMVLADIHLANRTSDRAQFDANILPDLNGLINSYTTSGAKVYAITLGDMSWDAYWYDNNFALPEYVTYMNKINCPVFNTMGNHDNDQYREGDLNGETPYRNIIGPTYYSFNLGKVHYVVLDNIVFINTGGKQGTAGQRNSTYTVTAAQLEWLTKDLATITDKNTPVVVSMHVPLYGKPNVSSSVTLSMSGGQDLVNCFAGFSNVHVLTGHTHVNYTVPASTSLIEDNIAALSGTWWWTGHTGYAGNHISPDGSPGGYGVYEANNTNLKWYYKSIGYDKNYQFRSYDLNKVHITAAKYAPSANSTYAAKMAGYAGTYATANNKNEVLINVWRYDPQWKVEVFENSVSLPITRVSAQDPLHIISYEAKRLNVNAEPTASFLSVATSHMFKATAASPNSTLEIKVTDRFGNVYSESMKRPKELAYVDVPGQGQGEAVIFYDNFDWAPGDNTTGANLMTSTVGERRYSTWTTSPVLNNPGWTSTSASDGVSPTPATAAWLYTRNGFMKLGKTATDGDLISPALTKIQGTQNVIVSFKAAAYSASEAGKSLRIQIVGPGTFASNSTTVIAINPLNAYAANWLTDTKFHYSYEIKGATAETKIRFISGTDNNVGGQVTTNRVGIDEVNVTLIPDILLDVKFNNDGTAEDISLLKNSVITSASQPLVTTHNAAFGDYTARFHHNNPGTSVADGYYRINYNTSTTIKDGLADGHTLETYFTLKNFPATDLEIKMFSAMATGGTGFLIGNNSRSRHIIFLPYVGGAYKWTDSGITPELNRWYHVVGVYDKAAAKTHIYVDGVLKASLDAAGAYTHPSNAASHWFAIGGDAGPSNLESAWQGDIAIARIYNNALTGTQVSNLYDAIQAKNVPDNTGIVINGIDYSSGVNVIKGGQYTVTGSGFVSGDQIRFTPVSGPGTVFTCPGTVTTSNITITIPGDFVSEKYRMAVVRGTGYYDLGFVTLTAQAPATLPVADLLDIVFKNDGTAEDISPIHSPVMTSEAIPLLTTHNAAFGNYTARFHHNNHGSSVSSGYYRINYENNNTIKNGLTDGHTLETFFTLKNLPATDVEMKMFSSMAAGGTGFVIGKQATYNRHLYFLPHIGTTGYRWTDAGMTPELNRWYHVVGVYDKAGGKTYIYVDGVLKNTQTVAAGDTYNHPNTEAAQWFAIGGDASPNDYVEAAWQGDIAIARAYNKPLTAVEVSNLYADIQAKNVPNNTGIIINGISYLSGINVTEGSQYTITGSGFSSGDQIRFSPVSGSGPVFICPGTVTASNITITIPAGFVTDKYRMTVVRGTGHYDLGFVRLSDSSDPLPVPKVICHRGYWNTTGSAQNSIASLAKAQELQQQYGDILYGSEFDVYITSDDVLVINHDPTIGGVNIENNPYSAIQNMTLSNGEKIPTLAAYLAQGKLNPNVKLICEIKTHSSSANNNRAVDAIVAMVEATNMKDQVEYIAFSWDNCLRLRTKAPYAVVGYLNGDKTPQTLYDAGVMCMDYQMPVLKSNTGYVQQVRDLGMVSNVWTVNSSSDMQYFIELGVNFITTDEPVQLADLLTNIITSEPKISLPSANMKACSVNSTLLFNVLHPASIKIYTVTGILVIELNVEKRARIALPQGIYIIKSVSKDIIETIKIINN